MTSRQTLDLLEEWDAHKEIAADVSYLPPELCPECIKQRAQTESSRYGRRECKEHWDPDGDEMAVIEYFRGNAA